MPNKDDFSGSAGDDLSARTATGTGGGWSWATASGAADAYEISGTANRLKIGTGHATTTGVKAPDAGSPDHYAQAVIRTAANALFGCICVRMTDKDNWIGL